MKTPFPIVSLLINLITGIFKVEKYTIPGIAKEEMVLTGIAPAIEKANSIGETITWIFVCMKIIRSIVKILNEAFGHDWGKEKENATKTANKNEQNTPGNNVSSPSPDLTKGK